MLLSIATVQNENEEVCIMTNDVGRAHFYAPTVRTVYVQLCPEDCGPGEQGLCGRLNYPMNGARDAAPNWHNKFAGHLQSLGFVCGKASPCVFYQKRKGLRTLVHGDDQVTVG